MKIHFKDLKDAYVKRGYNYHFERAMLIDRKTLLQTNEKPPTKGNLPLKITFNKTLPIIKHVIDKYWHILSINEKFKKGFDKKLLIPYERNKNLHRIIGGNCNLKCKVVLQIIKTTENQENVHPAFHD